MVYSSMVWCLVWSSIEHYGIQFYSIVLGMRKDRALWYQVVQHGVGDGAR